MCAGFVLCGGLRNLRPEVLIRLAAEAPELVGEPARGAGGPATPGGAGG